MKVERYIKEYAAAKKRDIASNDLMRQDIKENAIKTINGALKAREKGLIIADEAIELILNCFE